MTYSKINITHRQDEVSGFSLKLFLLIIAVIATIGVNVMMYNSNNSTNLEAKGNLTPVTTEMVILVK